MIRLAIYSQNSSLPLLFGSALGDEFEVVLESTSQSLRARLSDEQADVIVFDLDAKSCSSQEELSLIQEAVRSRLPVLVMTDDDRRSNAIQLLRQGVYDYFRKPPSLVELKVVVRRAYEHVVMQRELEEVRQKLRRATCCDGLVGASTRIQSVYELIRRVRDVNAYVLIQGESGTGKELVARAIHNLSERREEPFVAVACGAIPETLVEAELFGHERGAFTGTNGARAGYIEQAGSGTLLLDEIGELSLSTQVKLLRVLQQKEFSRLGSNRLIPLRARVLFATHRNLARMVEEGTFRQDLYFRLNVMKIQIPPLRERLEDIPVLADHFLEKYTIAFGKSVREIRPSAMNMLLDHDWPGNVRELENVIQSAVILASSEAIGPEDLAEGLQSYSDACADSEPGSFERQTRDYKARLAAKAVVECNGNKTLAARNLRISRAYLHRLIRAVPEQADAC